MITLQIRYSNKLIQTKNVDTVPAIGEHIAFYSYDSNDLSKMNIREFVVQRILHLYKDPTCPEGFISQGIGEEVVLIDVLTPQDIIETQKSMHPNHHENDSSGQ